MRIHRVLVTLAFIPVLVMGEEAALPVENGWTGKGQVGYVASQGNTEAQSANAAIDAALVSGVWKHTFHLAGLYGKSAGIVSAERWETLWQSDYSFSPDLFSFGALRYARDMFSGFQYQGSVTAGLGYKFINTPSTQLNGQLGAGYRKSRPELIVKDDTSGIVLYRTLLDTTGEAVITAELDYVQQLSTSTNLSNKLMVESGSSNTLITDALALTVKMTDKLALSVGFNVQNNSNPPVGLKKTDTVETVNFVYSF